MVAKPPPLSSTACSGSGSVQRDSPYYLSAEIVVIPPSNHPPLCICGSKCHQMAITCIRSNYIDCVQGHRLLPPPHPWHQTSPLFALLTSCRNWSGCNVRPNCLTTDLDTCGCRFHAAFFQNVPCAQISFPNPSCPLPWSMHPHHLVRSAYVEPP